MTMVAMLWFNFGFGLFIIIIFQFSIVFPLFYDNGYKQRKIRIETKPNFYHNSSTSQLISHYFGSRIFKIP